MISTVEGITRVPMVKKSFYILYWIWYFIEISSLNVLIIVQHECITL